MTNKLERRQKLKTGLHQFRGTTVWHRYSPLFPYFLLTDGTKYLADTGECYWLMDKIAALQEESSIKNHPKLRSIQFWNLEVHEDSSATLYCEWDKGKVVYRETIEWTDFPLERIALYCCLTTEGRKRDGLYYILILPSEY
ncbi:hypothetical protein IQ235_05225 [Oscillatoriales cyanobacterium LEGE 11467]|uniref:DUF6876 domain-containing protein n=1 Tax=Zarconia navalis LEGE 11467 TaxID=1828826 RepID=A0A928Z7Z6_9CYAN|nr:DUF6876 family protein [Zarconia navalis]MBE9040193.1 hypothetical protein [Zarconia navalis LEGE 11467]